MQILEYYGLLIIWAKRRKKPYLKEQDNTCNPSYLGSGGRRIVV
jgi:hypothetical protein